MDAGAAVPREADEVEGAVTVTGAAEAAAVEEEVLKYHFYLRHGFAFGKVSKKPF